MQKTIAENDNLMAQWDAEKNNKAGLDPKTLTIGSNRYAYWKCHVCGYEWQAKINNRANGRGCPYCSHRALVPGKNDLGTTHPVLVKEWHPTKNADLTPVDVTYGMAKKVWWLCPNGHEYQATILHRATGNTNCPICNNGRQTSFREQALFYYVKKLFPNAISRYKPENFERFELDIYIPDWRLAIEYDGVAWHKDSNFDRERRKYRLCREQGIKLIRVKEKMPEEARYGLADAIISTDDFETEQGFTQAIHFVLEKIYRQGFYWMHAVDVNLSRDRFDIMKYATEIKHSFQDAYPDLAKEWHPTKNKNLKPSMFKPKSDFKAWWRCPLCGNEYEQSLYLRARGCGCPVCAKDKQVKTLRENLIKKNGSISNSALLKEWNYEKNGSLKPEHFTRAADQKVWWKCAVCGHEWQAKISNREHGRGCPKCADTKLFIGENDLATIHPELLAEWDYSKNNGIDPHAIHHGSNKKVWWKCSTCGYEYQAPIARRDKGSGCRKCADKANPDLIRATILKKRGSLGDVCPDLIPEYAPDNAISIFEIASTSHQKVKWICSVCGHEWEAAPYTRKRGHGCILCGRIKSAQSRRKNRTLPDNPSYK